MAGRKRKAAVRFSPEVSRRKRARSVRQGEDAETELTSNLEQQVTPEPLSSPEQAISQGNVFSKAVPTINSGQLLGADQLVKVNNGIEMALGTTECPTPLPDTSSPNCLSSVCDSLGQGLSPHIKEKIWKGEFVDFGSLISKNLGSMNKLNQYALAVDGSSGSLMLKPSMYIKGVGSIDEWIDAFLVFASIYIQKHATRAIELLKYASIIKHAHRSFGGWGWKVYDEQFRSRQALQPNRSWASIDAELWLLVLSPIRTPFRSGGPLQRERGGPSNYVKLCFSFNKGGCKRKDCRFPHICSKCHTPGHPVSKCGKAGV